MILHFIPSSQEFFKWIDSPKSEIPKDRHSEENSEEMNRLENVHKGVHRSNGSRLKFLLMVFIPNKAVLLWNEVRLDPQIDEEIVSEWGWMNWRAWVWSSFSEQKPERNMSFFVSVFSFFLLVPFLVFYVLLHLIERITAPNVRWSIVRSSYTEGVILTTITFGPQQCTGSR